MVPPATHSNEMAAEWLHGLVSLNSTVVTTYAPAPLPKIINLTWPGLACSVLVSM